MTYFIKSIIIFISLSILFSCNRGEGETVESAYIIPPYLDPSYSFKRNGESTVDNTESGLMRDALGIIYSDLRQGQLSQQFTYERAYHLYNDGTERLKPTQEIATSSLHINDKGKINNDIIYTLEKSKQISDYLISQEPDSRETKPGKMGITTIGLGKEDRAYVDEKGVAVSELFDRMTMGAIYLDKSLNFYLNKQFFDDPKLKQNHENTILLSGRNYTQLENYWDLAYGYYQQIQSYAQADGLPALKESSRKIGIAFALGRYYLVKFRYDEMKEQMKIIKYEVSKVMAARTMNLLVGEITLINYDEKPQQAFVYLSQASGMIYAMQFTQNSDEKAYFSYDEVKNLQNKLIGTSGFWEKERLLADENVDGSLRNIALKIGKPFNLKIEDIRR